MKKQKSLGKGQSNPKDQKEDCQTTSKIQGRNLQSISKKNSGQLPETTSKTQNFHIDKKQKQEQLQIKPTDKRGIDQRMLQDENVQSEKKLMEGKQQQQSEGLWQDYQEAKLNIMREDEHKIKKIRSSQKKQQTVLQHLEDNNYTTCPICQHSFNFHLRVPLMVCINQHNVCLHCTNRILKKKNKKCPLCNITLELQKPLTKHRNRFLCGMIQSVRKAMRKSELEKIQKQQKEDIAENLVQPQYQSQSQLMLQLQPYSSFIDLSQQIQDPVSSEEDWRIQLRRVIDGRFRSGSRRQRSGFEIQEGNRQPDEEIQNSGDQPSDESYESSFIDDSSNGDDINSQQFNQIAQEYSNRDRSINNRGRNSRRSNSRGGIINRQASRNRRNNRQTSRNQSNRNRSQNRRRR